MSADAQADEVVRSLAGTFLEGDRVEWSVYWQSKRIWKTKASVLQIRESGDGAHLYLLRADTGESFMARHREIRPL